MSASKRARRAKRQAALETYQPPAPQQGRLVSRSVQQVSTAFSGPIPPPEYLEGYEKISPGAAKQILDMAETQTNHRIELEKKVIESDIRNSSLGMFLGFALALFCIVWGCYLIMLGHDTAGAAVATTTVVALVSVFVYGSETRRERRKGSGQTWAR